MKKQLICRVCGKPFKRNHWEVKKNKTGKFYCSLGCRNKDRKGESNSNYGNRNPQEIKALMSQNRSGKPAWNKGLTKEDSEAVKKYSTALLGNKFGKKNRGKQHPKLKKMNLENNPMHDPEIRRKAALSLKGKKEGEKNPNWRGGSSFLPYCTKFNEALKE